MKQKKRAYKYPNKEELEQYYKVILVDFKNNDCKILKGPEDERKLIEILQDDYNCSKYDKWVALIANEKVKKEDADFFRTVFSSKNIKKEFRRGKEYLEYYYFYIVDGEERRARAKICHKGGFRCFPRKVMIYVKI